MKTELKTSLTWERKQDSQRVPNKINPRRTTPRHTVIKIKRLKTKRLKAIRENLLVTNEGTPIRLSADFAAETLQARREWHHMFKVMKWKTYKQKKSTHQHYRSDLMEKLKCLRTNKELKLILKLKYFGSLMQRANSLENTLMLGRIESRRRGETEGEMI